MVLVLLQWWLIAGGPLSLSLSLPATCTIKGAATLGVLVVFLVLLSDSRQSAITAPAPFLSLLLPSLDLHGLRLDLPPLGSSAIECPQYTPHCLVGLLEAFAEVEGADDGEREGCEEGEDGQDGEECQT